MEFSAFADDLFGESEGRQMTAAPISYNARLLQPQWFNQSDQQDPDQEQNKIRFSADHAFYKNKYEEALEKYQQCLSMIAGNNVTVWRDLNEAIAHCYANLNRQQEAINILTQIIDKAITFEQKTSAWYTAARVYSKLGLPDKELSMRQALTLMHSSNPTLWKRLGQLYVQIQKQAPPHEGQSSIKPFMCFTRSRLLHEAVCVNVTGLQRDRNLQEQDEVQRLIKSLDVRNINTEKVTAAVHTAILNSHDKDNDKDQLTDHQLAVLIQPQEPTFSHDFEMKFFVLDGL